MSAKIKFCDKCQFSVAWAQTKEGKFYLVSDTGKRGRSARIPHYLECDTLKAKRIERGELMSNEDWNKWKANNGLS
jgi:hypothetical protein